MVNFETNIVEEKGRQKVSYLFEEHPVVDSFFAPDLPVTWWHSGV